MRGSEAAQSIHLGAANSASFVTNTSNPVRGGDLTQDRCVEAKIVSYIKLCKKVLRFMYVC